MPQCIGTYGSKLGRPKNMTRPKRRTGSGYKSGVDKRGGARTGVLSRASRPGKMGIGKRKRKIGSIRRTKLGTRR